MKKENQKNKKHSNSLLTAATAHSATAQVRRHSGGGLLASTGTNVSYEGATAPGAGGSVGTGFASGQPATGEKITVNSDFVQNRGGTPAKSKKAAKPKNK